MQLWKLNGRPANASLDALMFDKQAILWFTDQGGAIGRFDQDREMQVWDAPRGYGPYGITLTPQGTVWYVSLAQQLSRRDGPRDGRAAHRRATTPSRARAACRPTARTSLDK